MNKQSNLVLLFVYNTDEDSFDPINTLKNYLQKESSQDSIVCHLYNLTTANPELIATWKKMIKKLPFRTQFLYKQEFLKKYPGLKKISLPAIFYVPDDAIPRMLIEKKEIEASASLTSLYQLITEEMQKIPHHFSQK